MLAAVCLRPRQLPSLAWLAQSPSSTRAAVPAGHHLAPDVSMGTGDGRHLKGLAWGQGRIEIVTNFTECLHPKLTTTPNHIN